MPTPVRRRHAAAGSSDGLGPDRVLCASDVAQHGAFFATMCGESAIGASAGDISKTCAAKFTLAPRARCDSSTHMPTCFLDCEFTDLIQSELLSIGLVDLSGAEHYVELDLDSEVGQQRVRASTDFVRWGGVLDFWGLVPGATSTEWEMGRRTADWLLGLAAESGTRVEVCFDCEPDWELMEYAIRDSGLWDRVREVVLPMNVSALTGTIDGELAAEGCFRGLAARGLRRHHALADALALRSAYLAVKANALSLTRFVRTDDFRRLVATAGGPDWESWTRRWLLKPAFGLGRRPIDIAAEPGGIGLLEGYLGRIGNG